MQRPFRILLILLIGLPIITNSQNYPTGGRAIALANAFVSIPDPWSSFHNQAGLANWKTLTAGVFHESRFLIDELTLTAGTFILPNRNGNFAFSFYQFGKGTFKEHKIGLAFSKTLANNFNLGLQLDYFSQQYPENEKAFGFATFELGATYQISEEVTLGAHIFNPIKKGINAGYEKGKSPYIFRVGGHYNFSEYALLVFESQKTSDQNIIFKSGLEFYPHNNIAFRIGVSGKSMQLSSGFGYKHKQISTDVSFSYHDNLGVTPSVSLQFQIK